MNYQYKIKSLCSLPVPYPEVRAAEKNANYAKLLLFPYAGDGGELGAILSYSYWHIVSANEQPETLSATLECVSMTEMRHLEILAELIFLLGGNPKYCDQRGCFSAGRLNYATDPKQIIQGAINAEKNAIKVYSELITRIDDEYVRENLKRIKLDEEHHLKLFSELQGDTAKKPNQ